jgi:hypothetical protein
VNNVYSFRKEQACRDPLNLIAVLQRQRRLSLPRAFAAAARIYNADLDRFDARVAALRYGAGTSPSEIAYADGLVRWIYGNLAWTQLSRRYRSA